MPNPTANSEPVSDSQTIFGDSITAIVPARDEDLSIETCVRSLAQQSELAEIIVVNDHSTDRTAAIVGGLTSEIANLQLLQAPEVPAGWLGKNHAIWQGAQRAKSRWLLFVDADAELLDGAAARALQIARDSGAALVSFSPEQIVNAWYEKALIPFVYHRLSRYFPYDSVNDAKSEIAAANGQFLMMRTDIYTAIGGHASVAGDVLEDVALAKRVKQAGNAIWFGSGAGVVRARMYRSFPAMWEGWKKNLYLLVGGTPRAVRRELSAAVPWIPFALLLLGFKTPIALVAGAGLLLARHAVYASTLLRNHFRGLYILYYAPGALLYAAVLWASYRAHAAGAVEWKGRQVALKAAR